jgi:hypothetical protein
MTPVTREYLDQGGCGAREITEALGIDWDEMRRATR